ncbi:hypothetical protein OEZ85_012524 [Tetradesmus obliquus]|uniref:Ion transport domain-containing protein n=1 Tax=Tetradesmus obliquus TaxID=3088 RepID=A0ABY8TTP9_TETOB|nr:hypothetical protein OEZ85_012524 [Tetradesmus obliquus]
MGFGLGSRKSNYKHLEDQAGWRSRLGAATDAAMNSMAVAVLFDLADAALYFLDILTDVKVMQAFSRAGYTLWLYLSIWFVTWHYTIMAGLLVGAARRAAAKWGAYEYADRSGGSRPRSPLWLLSLPVALPGVVALDLMMLLTSVLSLMVRHKSKGTGAGSGSSGSAAVLSSFLSNYNFTRLFLEFVCESVPQTVLQMYIVSELIYDRLATRMDITTVSFSLFISSVEFIEFQHSVNVVKYTWKFRKAARQAGMNFWEYAKYILLLKVSERHARLRQLRVRAVGAGGADGGVLPPAGRAAAAAPPEEHVRAGAAGAILMRSLKALQGRRDVKEFAVIGCPLPCVNRLLQLGLAQFPCLELLELRESAFRGNTWRGVLEALRVHASCRQLRVVQTGVFARYKNFKKEGITESFKPCAAYGCTRGAASSAELRFLGKYSPCEVHLSAGTSLAGLLTHSSSLASLALHNQALHPLGLSCMALAAARSSSLTSLSLRGSAVGDQGAIELARLLASCPCLASLCLRGCGLHQEGGAALGAALPQARRLVKLDLSANRLAGPRCIVALASGLRLSGCGVSSAGGPGSSAAAAAAGLQELLLEEVDDLGEQLSRLSLAGSGLSGTALAAMAAAGLAAAAALACLGLSVPEAKMQKASASQRPTGTEGGMAPAADGMRTTRSAASLAGLAGSRKVSSAGMIEQYEAAADEGDGDGGAGLVRLSLAWAAAGSQAAAPCCLRELNLKGQPLPQPAAAALALAIKQLPVLQTLKLSDPFGLGEQQLGVLCLAVAAAPALQQLELQQCSSGAGSRGALGLAAARAIAQIISAPGSHLLSLDLSFSCFSEEAEEADAVWCVLAGALVCSKHARAGRRGWQRCISSKAASASLDALMASAVWKCWPLH